MIKKLSSDVCALVDEEYSRASKQWGPEAASGHEGYALIKEELEEAQLDMEALEQQLGHFWSEVKADEFRTQQHYLSKIKNISIHAACELIQVAAMAEKTLVWAKKLEERSNEKTAESNG